jgi:hypothetical protein
MENVNTNHTPPTVPGKAESLTPLLEALESQSPGFTAALSSALGFDLATATPDQIRLYLGKHKLGERGIVAILCETKVAQSDAPGSSSAKGAADKLAKLWKKHPEAEEAIGPGAMDVIERLKSIPNVTLNDQGLRDESGMAAGDVLDDALNLQELLRMRKCVADGTWADASAYELKGRSAELTQLKGAVVTKAKRQSDADKFLPFAVEFMNDKQTVELSDLMNHIFGLAKVPVTHKRPIKSWIVRWCAEGRLDGSRILGLT